MGDFARTAIARSLKPSAEEQARAKAAANFGSGEEVIDYVIQILSSGNVMQLVPDILCA